MKKYRNIFLFGIFIFVFFLVPNGVEAADKRVIYHCEYGDATAAANQAVVLEVYEDFTYQTFFTEANQLKFNSGNNTLDTSNWQGCPTYAAYNSNRGFYYTDDERNATIFSTLPDSTVSFVSTLSYSSEVQLCYYDERGRATDVGNAFFSVYRSDQLVSINSLSSPISWGMGDIPDMTGLAIGVVAAIAPNLQIFSLSQMAFFDESQIRFQCPSQVYLVPHGEASFELYGSKELVPDGSITTDDLYADNEAMNQQVGCKTLFNFDQEGSVGWFLQRILDYMRIFAPIIVVLLSSIDFIKAIFSSDEKATKEAQRKLVIRLVCALALFLVPTLIEFLLYVINGLSNPSCGFH